MGISKDAYFRLTPGETRAIYDGYMYNRDMASANFRPLLDVLYNANYKPKRTMKQLWPLSIDNVNEPEPMTEAEMYERNRQVIEQYRKITGDKTIN